MGAYPVSATVVWGHGETSDGTLIPVAETVAVVAARGRKRLIDSMIAFGALPLEVEAIPYTAMVSSANKCIEGVPGFGFVIARKDELASAKGRCHSRSLDLHAQWASMDQTAQWCYTHPPHLEAAFLPALDQPTAEGNDC